MAKMWRKPFDAEENKFKSPQIFINKDRCKGCGYCTEFCPRDALVMSREINEKGYTSAAIADESKCLGCGLCEIMCPEFAIKLARINNE
jgi:2-oxoglutarate ferredoxin oxidoreductase subunit delta